MHGNTHYQGVPFFIKINLLILEIEFTFAALSLIMGTVLSPSKFHSFQNVKRQCLCNCKKIN